MNLVENAVLFDKYRVGDVFDQNSVFTTYLGTQINGGAPVYIKLLDQARFTQYDVDKICFNNELPAIKALSNRHILRTLDAGPISNTICIISEFADYIPLDRFLENRRVLDLSLSIDFITQLAEALRYAHERNVIHRSIKAGAIGVFSNKYSDVVRTYTIGEYSMEMCAGPHAEKTGDLGHFSIQKEQSSSAGVRRIKAILT